MEEVEDLLQKEGEKIDSIIHSSSSSELKCNEREVSEYIASDDQISEADRESFKARKNYGKPRPKK